MLFICYRIDFKAQLPFKALNVTGPNDAPTRSMKFQNKNLLVQPVVKTKCGESALVFTGLDFGINSQICSHNCYFKSKLKTKLFSEALS